MEYSIEVEGLRKAYRKGGIRRRLASLLGRRSGDDVVVALDGITFRVRRGEVFGFLGPNGAGKTTTVKILTTVLVPDEGEARVLGYDVVRESLEVRKRIGVLPEDSQRGFGWRLTAFENLLFYAYAYLVPDPRERVREVLELVGLGREHWDKWYQRLSQGMKQKLALARALLPDPEVLFLDEPTKGLDVVFAARFKEMVRERFGDRSRTVFLSTHDMGLVEATCDRVAIVDKGRIVAVTTVEELKSLVPGEARDAYVLEVDQASARRLGELASKLDGLGVEWHRVEGRRLVFGVEGGSLEAANEILRAAVGMGLLVRHFGRREVSVEEVIVRLLGGGGGEG